jgi:hypothetical protein
MLARQQRVGLEVSDSLLDHDKVGCLGLDRSAKVTIGQGSIADWDPPGSCWHDPVASRSVPAARYRRRGVGIHHTEVPPQFTQSSVDTIEERAAVTRQERVDHEE